MCQGNVKKVARKSQGVRQLSRKCSNCVKEVTEKFGESVEKVSGMLGHVQEVLREGLESAKKGLRNFQGNVEEVWRTR